MTTRPIRRTWGKRPWPSSIPKGEDFATAYNQLAYRNLSNDMLDYVNTLWENLKIN